MSDFSKTMNSPKVGGYLDDADGQFQMINVMTCLIYYGMLEAHDANAIAIRNPVTNKMIVLAIDVATSITTILDPTAIALKEEELEDFDLLSVDLSVLTNKATN